MLCPKCGATNEDSATNCTRCGAPLKEAPAGEQAAAPAAPAASGPRKQKVVAGLLALLPTFLCGIGGIHNFYLGYTNRALIQLGAGLGAWAVWIVSTVATAICCLGAFGWILGLLLWVGNLGWHIYEAVLIFQGKLNDAAGQPLE